MMIVTGAAGFPGSCLISKLNQQNFNYIIAVDHFGNAEKEENLAHKKIQERVAQEQLFAWMAAHYRETEFFFHFDTPSLAADNQDSTIQSASFNLSKEIWQRCVAFQIPFLYISSAYGAGKVFEDWAVAQEKKPFFWAILKLPEVYGPNEYYLEKEASVVFRWLQQLQKNRSIGKNLLKEQLPSRDLLYVKDLVEICYFLVRHRQESGVYEVGTGHVYSKEDILNALSSALDITEGKVRREQYEENKSIPLVTLTPLQSLGYQKPVLGLKAGALDYVQHYLQQGQYY